MHIPESLQHFAEPSLIVTADHVHAKLWLAFEDSLEDIELLEMPKELKTDNEGGFYNPDTGGVSASEGREDEERVRKFIRALAKRVDELVRDEQAAQNVHLLMPEDMLHPFKEELSPECVKRLGKELAVSVMKEDATRVLERIVSA